MTFNYAATLLDPETSDNLIAALRTARKTDEEIDALWKEACRMGAEALRQVELMDDDKR